MSTNATAKKNTSFRLNNNLSPDVIKVFALSNYALAVEFEDGLHGIIEMKKCITSCNPGVFAKLQDINLFNSVEVYSGVISWLDKNRIETIGHSKFPHIYADLASDTIYNEIKDNGVWEVN